MRYARQRGSQKMPSSDRPIVPFRRRNPLPELRRRVESRDHITEIDRAMMATILEDLEQRILKIENEMSLMGRRLQSTERNAQYGEGAAERPRQGFEDRREGGHRSSRRVHAW